MIGMSLSLPNDWVMNKAATFFSLPKKLQRAFVLLIALSLSATTVMAQIPAVPTSVTATTASSTQINLTWVDASTNETGFQIERSTTSSTGFALIFTTAANAVSYSDAGVVANTMYYYRIRSTNGSGSSAYSTQTGSSTITPSAPSGLTATVGTTTSINLAWVDGSADETGFQIWMSTTAGSGYSLIATNPANQVTRSVTGLSVNVRYYFQVRAINGALTSAYTNEATSITSTPALPTSVTAIATSPTQITLSWVDNATIETGYGVERSTTSGTGFVLVTTAAINATGFVDTGLTTGTTYYYRIRALNGGLPSAYTTQIGTAIVVPAAPTTLTATAASATQVNLTWVDASTNETGFVVERSTTSGSGFTIVTTTAANATSYSDVSAVANTTYYYRIRSTNGVGSSANTAEVMVATSAPSTPTNFVASLTNSSGGVTLTWTDASNNETGFEIERSSTSASSGFSLVFTNAANTVSRLNTGLAVNTWYYYRIRSINAVGASSYSPVASVYIGIPAGPTGVAYTIISPTQVDFTWTDPNNFETGYVVQRSTTSTTAGFVVAGNLPPNTVSFSDVGLTAGTVYYYRIQAVNGVVAINSSVLTVSLTVPAAPTLFRGWPSTTTEISMSWTDNATNESGYEIERSTTSGSGYTLINTTAANATTFTNTGLTNGSTYYYRIRSKNPVGLSAYSPEIVVPITAPIAPTSPGAAPASITQINLTWTDNSNNESAFRIERGTSATGPFSFIFNTSPNVVFFASAGLNPGVRYFYRILSTNGVGSSSFTSVFSAATYLVAPTNLVATAFSTNQINLTWTDASSNETGYQIERSLTAGSGYVLVATTAPQATSYSDTGIQDGTTYYYRVRAINAVSNSLYTTESMATTLFAPPISLSAVAVSSTQLKLKWVDASLVETGFQIERSTTSGTGYTLVNTTPANTTEYIDQGLTANTQYYYRIRSINAVGASPYTNELPFETLTLEEETINNFAFLYKYDGSKRMTHKKVPGADWVYMVYDNRDRLVMTQDGNQRLQNQWTFTKYDALNRPVLTGIYTHGSAIDQATMQGVINSYYDNLATNNGSWYETFSSSGAVHGYDNKSFPLVSDVNQYLTVTYYDDYGFKALYSNDPANDYRTGQLSAQTTATGTYSQATWNQQVKGQVTASKTKVLGSSPTTFLLNVVYYDDKYRSIQTIADNHKGGKDCTTNIYDFSGKVLATKTVHGLPSVADKTTARTFDYDHAGRLLKTWHSINGAITVLLTQNEYNEIGQLVTKNLHNTDPAATPDANRQYKQSVDYRYNIRGWLTKVNDVTTSTTGDLFSMDLNYNTSTANGGTPQYNGNISETIWRGPDARTNSYGYAYDPMNRLVEAKYYNTTDPTRNGRFDEKIWNNQLNTSGYDLNGNIKFLTRKGKTGVVGGITTYGQMDDLSYAYFGNQLQKVDDSAVDTEGFVETTTGNDYTYDVNGNMVTDQNKGITGNIVYNHLNLPEKVTKNTNEYIKYTYDAGGRKLKQEVYNSSNVVTKTTDYIGEYIYENNVLQFINHEEGRIVKDAASGNYNEYQYHLKDHLGNVRLTFTTKADEIDPATATFETANQSTEQGQFLNYDKVRRINGYLFDRTAGVNPTTTAGYAVRLSGSETEKVGLARSISVMPGDKVQIEAYAKYFDPSNSTNQTWLTTLISQIASNTAAGGIVVDGIGYASNTATGVPFGNSLNKSAETGTLPKAYLNWLVFDQDYNVILSKSGYKRVLGGREDGSDVAFYPLKPDNDITITEAGYVYIWLSNENETPVEVCFDDFKVTQTKSQVVSMNDYYPFGGEFNSYQRENSVQNRYKFNEGSELVDDLGLQIYWTDLREYDPWGRLGWWQIDPMAEMFPELSPYNYAFNNPVRYNDPYGDCPTCPQGEEADKVYARGAIVENNRGAWIYLGGGQWLTLDKTKNGYVYNADDMKKRDQIMSGDSPIKTYVLASEAQGIMQPLNSRDGVREYEKKYGTTSSFYQAGEMGAFGFALAAGSAGASQAKLPGAKQMNVSVRGENPTVERVLQTSVRTSHHGARIYENSGSARETFNAMAKYYGGEIKTTGSVSYFRTGQGQTVTLRSGTGSVPTISVKTEGVTTQVKIRFSNK